MTYEMFKEIVIQEIKGYLPSDWQGVEIQRIQCQKNNYISNHCSCCYSLHCRRYSSIQKYI